jgi:hypothetical protein
MPNFVPHEIRSPYWGCDFRADLNWSFDVSSRRLGCCSDGFQHSPLRFPSNVAVPAQHLTREAGGFAVRQREPGIGDGVEVIMSGPNYRNEPPQLWIVRCQPRPTMASDQRCGLNPPCPYFQRKKSQSENFPSTLPDRRSYNHSSSGCTRRNC